MSRTTKKPNLRDRLDDCTLDLSMSDLEEVPVKDIALIKKGTHLDLSINKLTDLGINFATLTYLTKLDLSKNLLTELPQNFGELTLLKHLDLYGNKLTHLPLSFCRLKSLRWLDLKENPLVPVLAEVAGLCLDQQQCQMCARKVVVFLQNMQQQVDDTKLLLDEKKRKELEMAKKKEDLIQKEEMKKKKKAAAKSKDKKKENGVKASQNAAGDSKMKKPPKAVNRGSSGVKVVPKKSSGDSFCGKLFKLTLILVLLCAVSLSALWVADREKFVQLQDVSVKVWDQFVDNLPPQVVEASSQAVNAASPAIKLVNNKIQEGYSWLNTNESFRFLVVQVSALWSVFCERITELYRILGKLIPIYFEAVKKMIY